MSPSSANNSLNLSATQADDRALLVIDSYLAQKFARFAMAAEEEKQGKEAKSFVVDGQNGVSNDPEYEERVSNHANLALAALKFEPTLDLAEDEYKVAVLRADKSTTSPVAQDWLWFKIKGTYTISKLRRAYYRRHPVDVSLRFVGDLLGNGTKINLFHVFKQSILVFTAHENDSYLSDSSEDKPPRKKRKGFDGVRDAEGDAEMSGMANEEGDVETTSVSSGDSDATISDDGGLENELDGMEDMDIQPDLQELLNLEQDGADDVNDYHLYEGIESFSPSSLPSAYPHSSQHDAEDKDKNEEHPADLNPFRKTSPTLKTASKIPRLVVTTKYTESPIIRLPNMTLLRTEAMETHAERLLEEDPVLGEWRVKHKSPLRQCLTRVTFDHEL